MSNLLYILLMAPQGDQNPLMSLLPLVAIIGVFYFFMIRPQMKRQKEQKKFRESLAIGDKVITIGGIYGKIAEVQDTTITLEVEGKVRMRVDKSAVVKDPSDIIQQK